LAISLTFGGRRAVGPGFGIPLILRNILEFCTTVDEAADVLRRVPTHMAYNVTAVDRQGRFMTAYVSPDKKPVIKNIPYATNHQGRVEWHDHARATATLEREQFIKFRLADNALTQKELIGAFAKPPLYTNAYKRGFGTLYTAVYDPVEGKATFIWPDNAWTLSLDNFEAGSRTIQYVDNRVQT